VYSESHGKAAVLSGALTELWGFDTDEFRLPSEDEILSAKEKCGDDKLIFDDGKKVYIPDGAKLNLGSAGKGIALDEAVKRIEKINSQGGKITGAVISVGGSVATYGLPKKGKSWNVGIRDPYKRKTIISRCCRLQMLLYQPRAIMKRGLPPRTEKHIFTFWI